jgi:hypothetical protein
VNVVFLLLTAANAGWQGAPPPQQPAAKPIVQPAAPVVSSSCGDGCCGAVSDCCGCGKPSFFDRIRAKFAHHSSCCEAPAPCCQSAPAPTCCGAVSSCCDTCCDSGHSHGLFARIRAKFSKGGCCESSCGDCCGSTGHAAPGLIPGAITQPGAGGVQGGPAGKQPEQIKKLPSGDEKKGKIEGAKPDNKGQPDKKKEDNNASLVIPPLVTPAAGKTETGAKNPFELARRYELRVTHAADYGRLTGRLSFVHADGGLWVLRYAPLAQEDRHGGSVILTRDQPMNNYREGDLVTVEGQIISERGSVRLGAPLYRVQSIRLVDRPQ